MNMIGIIQGITKLLVVMTSNRVLMLIVLLTMTLLVGGIKSTLYVDIMLTYSMLYLCMLSVMIAITIFFGDDVKEAIEIQRQKDIKRRELLGR